MQLQLGVHGRQSQAHCQPPLGLRQRAQRLRLRPLQPLLPAGRRIWHSGRAERGLSLRTAAESGFGLTRQAGRDWLQSLLSRFGPMNDRASNAHVLDFERPLVELDNRIKEVRKVAEDNGVDVSGQIKELEQRAMQLRRDTYARLTATQRLQVARHANRPTFLDIALNITDKFVELHGDRAGLDDPAIVCGLGSIDGISFMLIGHQKGRNTKENIYRNFGMPQPNGYRKALRFMKHANQFGFPILTFVDTPGAFAGKSAEELGQGEAIAMNLREMFGLRVPVISVVIGEGGSGGALAIGCANWNLIMEHSVYYVASPEACAAILWKSRAKAGAATEALKITAPDLVKAGVMDEIIREPLGAAHADPMAAFPYIKDAILRIWHTKYSKMTSMEVMADRYAKFRKLGEFSDFKVKGGRVRAAVEERKQLQLAGGGVHAKSGQWAATQEEADTIDRSIARNKAWVRSLQDKEQWLNRPRPDGTIDLDALTKGMAFKLPGAEEEREKLAAQNYMRMRVVEAKRLVLEVRKRRGYPAAKMMAERLGARLAHEKAVLRAQLNGKPAPPMPQLPPLPPPSKEELAVMERQIRGLPPARKAALAWAMKAPPPMREELVNKVLNTPLEKLPPVLQRRRPSPSPKSGRSGPAKRAAPTAAAAAARAPPQQTAGRSEQPAAARAAPAAGAPAAALGQQLDARPAPPPSSAGGNGMGAPAVQEAEKEVARSQR